MKPLILTLFLTGTLAAQCPKVTLHKIPDAKRKAVLVLDTRCWGKLESGNSWSFDGNILEVRFGSGKDQTLTTTGVGEEIVVYVVDLTAGEWLKKPIAKIRPPKDEGEKSSLGFVDSLNKILESVK